MEAHHCYRRKPDGEEAVLAGDERQEAKNREEDARIWISGLEAVKRWWQPLSHIHSAKISAGDRTMTSAGIRVSCCRSSVTSVAA